MKSEERHELKTNELGKLGIQAGRFIEAHLNQILLGLVVVLLGVAAWIWWERTRAAGSEGWSQLLVATSPDNYADVADRFAGTNAGAWARLVEAESHLHNGVRLMFTDRDAAVRDLEDAADKFEGLLRNRNNAPAAVRERALFGLARAREALSDGNTGPAIEAYERLLQEFPESVYARRATQRVEALKTGGSQEFYAWFHQQQPKPRDVSPPDDGLPPDHPPIPGQSPADMPTFPEIPDGLQFDAPADEDAPPAPSDQLPRLPVDDAAPPDDPADDADDADGDT
jgi:hypothetical protein